MGLYLPFNAEPEEPSAPPLSILLSKEALLHYMDHPVDWVEDVAKQSLDQWQADAFNDLIQHRFVSIRSGRGVGKTFFDALVICYFLTTRPKCKIMCTAPSKEQMFDALWAQCKTIIEESPILERLLEWTKDKISVRGHSANWFAVARTAEIHKPKDGGLYGTVESFQGKHAETEVYLLDEASGIEEAVHSTVMGSITSDEHFVLMTSNPTRTQGTFYDSHHSKADQWKTYHIDAEKSKRVSRAWLKRMLDTYGDREHPLYRIGVRGEFPSAQPNALYPLELVERAQQLDLEKLGLKSQYDPLILGIDIGRTGDPSAIAFQRGQELERVETFIYGDLMQVCGRIVQTLQKEQPLEARIDINGMGAGVYDRLRELGVKNIVGYNSGNAAKNPKQYINFRAESHWELRTKLERGTFKLPRDEGLKAEMTTMLYKITSAGKVQIEAKEEMLARGQKSPNKTDAAVMASAMMPVLQVPHYARFGVVPLIGR